MSRKTPRNRDGYSQVSDEIETLYHKLLDAFYRDQNSKSAKEIARRLEAVLTKRTDVAESIRGEEIRSIIAEVKGDLAEAIQHRNGEIQRIRELHNVAKNTSAWDYVLGQYDYGDLSDRLDLLAILYAEQGDFKRAIDTLQESKQLCETHQIKFDGDDLLDEFGKSETNTRQGIQQT